MPSLGYPEQSLLQCRWDGLTAAQSHPWDLRVSQRQTQPSYMAAVESGRDGRAFGETAKCPKVTLYGTCLSVNVHHNYLEGFLKFPLLDPTSESLCFTWFGVGLKNFHF